MVRLTDYIFSLPFAKDHEDIPLAMYPHISSVALDGYLMTQRPPQPIPLNLNAVHQRMWRRRLVAFSTRCSPRWIIPRT